MKRWTIDEWQELICFGESEELYEDAVKKYLMTSDEAAFLRESNLTLAQVFERDWDTENENVSNYIYDMFEDWNEKLGWEEFNVPKSFDDEKYFNEAFSKVIDVDTPPSSFSSEILNVESEDELIERLAEASEIALDRAYSYGIQEHGNNFGWLANLESARYVYDLLSSGERDLETLAAASHDGWSSIAILDFKKLLKLDVPTKPEKVLSRMVLAVKNYSELPETEKEKDRVAVRAILKELCIDKEDEEGL